MTIYEYSVWWYRDSTKCGIHVYSDSEYSAIHSTRAQYYLGGWIPVYAELVGFAKPRDKNSVWVLGEVKTYSGPKKIQNETMV
jgi:hypothetical protein